MSDSEDELPSQYGNASSYRDGSDDNDDDDDDEEPGTSWGLKRKKRTIGVISDSDDNDDAAEDMAKDDADSCDSDSSGGAPGAETCAICLGRMRGEVGSPDSCEHTFCKFCILEWSKNNPTCPQDRKPFTEIAVRKCLDGPVEKMLPVKKREEEPVVDVVLENPTFCEVCNECDREERLLLCDGCDLGYHLECLDPPLSEVPIEEWFCPLCTDVNAPEVLTNRRRSSAARPAQRERRESSSSSGRLRQQNENPRIPRTRATERIRARIQKKKIKNKLRRKKRKESKKAKIESGEIEDRRAPVKSLNEFRMFNELDADIDAVHNEDKFAEKLLAGTVVESIHRQSSQRKAAAVRRLREVPFLPVSSYSGRAKNRVLEIVNTQSDDNQSDVLSGILENQAIAFSSSKKLVLTNDRKLTKQPGIEIPCKILQEDGFVPEPLPSQKKTPERSEAQESSPNEKEEEVPDRKRSNEDTSINRSIDDHHSATRQQFQSRSTHVHHSERHREWRREYSHGGYSRESSSSSRHGEYERNRYHSRRSNDHHRSRYSPYDRHSSSSWNSRSHYKRSEYGKSERHYGRHDSSERRFDGHQNRDYSPGRKKETMEKESRSNRSDKHDKNDGHRAHSSKSRRSHSVSKGNSSHSSTHGENHHRSQWSFSYFNSDNLFSKRSSNLNSVGSSLNKGDRKDEEDVKLSSSEGIKSNPVEVSKEAQSDVAFAESSNVNNSSQKTKNNGSQESISGYCMITKLHDDQESMVRGSNMEPKAGISSVTEAGKEKDAMLSQDISFISKLPDSNFHCSGTDRLQSKDNSVESQGKEKTALKPPLGKKTKLAFLFGDTDVNDMKDKSPVHDIKDKSPAKTCENEMDTNKTGREKNKKSDQKAKLKNLFAEDIDDDKNLKSTVKPEHESSHSKINANNPIASGDKNMNANVESCQEGGTVHFSIPDEVVSGKKNKDKGTHSSKPGKEVSDKHTSRKYALSPKHTKGNDDKHHSREDSSSKHSKTDSDISNNKQDILLDDVKDVSEKDHHKNNSTEKDGKEDSIGKSNISLKGSKFSEKCHDKKSTSQHSRETREKKSNDTKNSSSSQSFKGDECYLADNISKAQKKQSSGAGDAAVDKSKVLDIANSISASSKKRKIEKECTESDYSTKEKSKYGQKNKNIKGKAYGDLFGDIDDIDSSSNSNLPEVEIKPEVETACSGALKAKVKSAVYDEDYSGKEALDVVQLSKCLKELNNAQDAAVEKNSKQTNKKELLPGSYPVSEVKQSCGTKPENDLRIKQRASLEAKVVQEVKKALDPYYRNKSITKDEYKEIVAKCVKKVVNAECGDVIEPEKMRSLAVGYIKLFKHRQMKSQT